MPGGVQTPPPLDFTAASTIWPQWKQRFLRYRSVVKLDEEPDERQVNTLIYIMGEEAETVFAQLTLEKTPGREAANGQPAVDPVDESKDFEVVLGKFERYFQPKSNTLNSRVLFNNRQQNLGESNEEFIRAVHALADLCNFEVATKGSMIRDRLVCGMKDANLSTDLQMKEGLTLEDTKSAMRAKETIVQQRLQREREVHSLRSEPRSTRGQGTMDNACRYCGRSHQRGKEHCKAVGQVCRKCGLKNHFSNVCKAPTSTKFTSKNAVSNKNTVRAGGAHRHRVHEAEVCPVEDSALYDTFTIPIVHASTVSNVDWIITVQVRNRDLECKVDTGAQCNCISLSKLQEVCPQPKLEQTTVQLRGYTGHVIRVAGSIRLTYSFHERQYTQTFIVVHTQAHTLIGLNTAQQMGLLSMHMTDTVTTDWRGIYQDVFKGLGCLPGRHDINLRDDAVPTVCASRQVPHALRPKLAEELKRLVTEEIIAPCDEPMDWVHPCVVVRKPNGSVRVCLDPRNLNKAIRREHFKLPTIGEIFSRMSGSEVFTTLDAKSGFHQLKLTEQSSDLTCFVSPFGRFKFLRLAFGLNSAPEVFHKAVWNHMQGLDGLEVYIDDLIIHAPTQELHDARLKAVMDRCRDIGLRLNEGKCVFSQGSVKFLGHTLTGGGLSPTRDKVSAIQTMKTPTSKKEVQRFLGLVTFLGKFCPQLSEMNEPLRQVVRHDVEFSWNRPQQTAFEKLKKCVASAPTLALFDPGKEVTISVDASKHSVGAVLLQDGKAVEYAAKALTKTQQSWAQIEKEMLAVLFGCRRFYYYVYGREQFRVETDHKPLLGIRNKPIDDVSLRLRQMVLHLQQFDFDLVYVPGTQMYIADALSRDCQAEVTPEDDAELGIDEDGLRHVANVIMTTDQHKDDYVRATERDPTLQALMGYVLTGWPGKRRECSSVCKPYWNIRHELSPLEGLLFYKDRLVVPAVKRRYLLEKLHCAHQGVTRMQQLAKTAIYWPGMSTQIEDLAMSCGTCRKHDFAQSKEPLIPSEVPDFPYQVVAMDFFHWDSKVFLLVVDYYSKWCDAVELTTTTAGVVTKELERIFADRGLPEVVRSDNGPPFSSAAFGSFLSARGIRLVTSSPGFPQSNGQAERMVQTVKRMMEKTGDKWLSALRALRNTPLGVDLPSPAQLLQGRVLRDQLPVMVDKLFPHSYDRQQVREKFESLKSSQKHYYDQKAAPDRTVLRKGQRTLVRGRDGEWFPGQVVEKDTAPRSYWIANDQGVKLRRNRQDLKPQQASMPEGERMGEPQSFGEQSGEEHQAPREKHAGDQPISSAPTSETRTCNGSTPATPTNKVTALPTPEHHTRRGRVIRKPIRYRD